MNSRAATDVVTTDRAAQLKESIRAGRAVVGVVGLGYVGLPLAVEFARAGLQTVGVDLDSSKTDRLNDGVSYIQDVPSKDVAEVRQDGRFEASTDFDRLREADIVFICVPTPITENKEPDMRYVRSASEAVAERLRAGQLIVLRSTTYPGTTQDILVPALKSAGQKEGLELGVDYFVAFSPERVDPGNTTFTTANTPIVVGGVTPACTDLTATAMERIVGQVHRVSSPRAAEMEKLLENIFRSVNIALVNELARLCDRIGGISMWEVVDAAATKPFGFMPFYPGPGLGGHCIPIDPYYLSWLARRYDFETNFITLSARTNEEMPYYVVEAVVKAIANQPISLADSKVLVLGAAFKKNVDDTRHSPADRVIELLGTRGVRHIELSDPFVSTFHAGSREYVSRELTPDFVREHHVVVLTTDHDNYPYEMIAENARCVVDTRNAFARLGRKLDNVTVLGGGDFV
ncbi:MAG: nucleotide sugar dehydrogenase [Rhodothermales bacterium]|nr:nucleotide sugar dehydrogenase [Rhodothermales bacterium]